MTQKKTKIRYSTDEQKHNHRDAFKGHRTKKHFISEVINEEAEREINDVLQNPRTSVTRGN